MGEAIGRERQAMRAHVADATREAIEKCTTLEARVRHLENQLARGAETETLSALHTEIRALRSIGRGHRRQDQPSIPGPLIFCVNAFP
jgi:hypothetical protein